MESKMSSELLAAIAGVVLSLAFSYIPGLSTKFAKLQSSTKRLIMAGLLLLTGAAAFGLSCAGVFATVTCDKAGILGLVSHFIAALIANQSAYTLSPETNAVLEAKIERYFYEDDEPEG